MKFIISSTTLLKSLQTISGVITTNNTLPILENFLFQGREEDILITASDQETTMSIAVTPSMMEDPDNITIPARILLETLKTYHETPLTFLIDTQSYSVEISADNAKFKLAGQSAEEYPRIPMLEEPATVTVKGELLNRAIIKTIFATGNDEIRPQMAGVFFQFTPEEATFVATDAHKLVRYRRTDAKASETMSFIMPKKPLNQLKNSVPSDDTDVVIEYNVTNARFSFLNVVLVCRLIEGRYPNYEAVIPRDNPNVMTIEKSILLAAIRRVSIYGNQSTHQIRFRIAGQMLSLNAEDIDFQNEALEELTCSYDGEDLEIGFNSKFMLEMLANVEVPRIRLEMSSASRAGLIIPEVEEPGDEDLLMLVMPVMLN